MDLTDTPDDVHFRWTLRAWLEAHVPEAQRLPSSPADAVEHSRAWQRALHAAGYVGLAWPAEYGGQAASPVRQVIFGEECARIGAPPLLNGIGIGILGPALIHHGSDAQKQRFLSRILTADDIWCQ